jgi:hypothetical protein
MLSLDDLMKGSGLPGPRANLTLLHRFMREGDAATAAACLKYATPDVANSPEEYAAMCGVLWTGWQKRVDRAASLAFLRPYASHASWRIRETVAIAIQEMSLGSLMDTLTHLEPWASGNPLEQRAVAAGICEPKLLKNPAWAEAVFRLLQAITLPFDHGRKLSGDEISLRKTLGYVWSVAVAAYPEPGKTAFSKLLSCKGKHALWIVHENLEKARLSKMDAKWVALCRDQIKN